MQTVYNILSGRKKFSTVFRLPHWGLKFTSEPRGFGGKLHKSPEVVQAESECELNKVFLERRELICVPNLIESLHFRRILQWKRARCL